MTKNNKKGSLLKLGLLGVGAAVVINELTKGSTNRSANINGAIATAIDTTDSAELIKTIDASPALQDYLKRLVPVVKGEKGADGATGDNGIDGNMIQNFGGSLLVNGAIEKNNASLWSGVFTLGDMYNNFNSVIVTTQNAITDFVQLKSEFLYKIELNYKSNINSPYGVGVAHFDNNKVSLNTFSYNSGIPLLQSSVFLKYKAYIGGNGTLGSLIDPSAVYSKLFFANGNGLTINSLRITKVELGEAVPYTLGYLPDGQFVYNPATGAVGRNNNGTINWFM